MSLPQKYLQKSSQTKNSGITSFRCDHFGATYFIAERFLHKSFRRQFGAPWQFTYLGFGLGFWVSVSKKHRILAPKSRGPKNSRLPAFFFLSQKIDPLLVSIIFCIMILIPRQLGYYDPNLLAKHIKQRSQTTVSSDVFLKQVTLIISFSFRLN